MPSTLLLNSSFMNSSYASTLSGEIIGSSGLLQYCSFLGKSENKIYGRQTIIKEVTDNKLIRTQASKK